MAKKKNQPAALTEKVDYATILDRLKRVMKNEKNSSKVMKEASRLFKNQDSDEFKNLFPEVAKATTPEEKSNVIETVQESVPEMESVSSEPDETIEEELKKEGVAEEDAEMYSFYMSELTRHLHSTTELKRAAKRMDERADVVIVNSVNFKTTLYVNFGNMRVPHEGFLTTENA